MRRILNGLLALIGYVPKSEMQRVVEGLEQEILIRTRLDSEIAFHRQLALARDCENSEMTKACNHLGAVTDRLIETLREVSPEGFNFALSGEGGAS